MKGLVHKIIPFSAVDGPGNRTAVFLQGCNFNCKYCHNPETIPCKSEEEAKWMEAEEVVAEVMKNVPFIRGVTFSGGECTLQKEFLMEVIPMFRGKGLSVLLDSNGSLDFSKEEALVEMIDGVMLDMKAFDKAEHKELTGRDNKLVLQNAVFLAERGLLTEVRTVIAPSLYSCNTAVEQIARLLAPYNKEQTMRYKLIQYRPHGVRKEYLNTKVPTKDYMEQMKQIVESYGFTDIILT